MQTVPSWIKYHSPHANKPSVRVRLPAKKDEWDLSQLSDIKSLVNVEIIAGAGKTKLFSAHSAEFLQLEGLIISGAEIDFQNFRPFPKLKILRLKNCSLKESLFLPEKIEILKLSGCGLTHIDSIIRQVPGLLELDLSANKIEELPTCLPKLFRLKRLNLDGNSIHSLTLRQQDFPNLCHFSIDDNPLSQESRQSLFEQFKIWGT